MKLDYISDIKIPLKKPSYENLRTFLKPSKFVHSNKNFGHIYYIELNKN